MNKKDLLEENKRLLIELSKKTLELNEIKRILKTENSRLWDRVTNPTINLPSGNQIRVSELNKS